MVLTLKSAVEALVMPPTSLFLLVLAGLAVARLSTPGPRRRAARAAAWLGGLLLLALSTPLAAYLLLDSLQTSPALPPGTRSLDAGAIVVLAGDVDCDPAEWGPDQPGALSLMRCRYGAALSRRTGVPLLVTGGVLRPDRRPVSHVLRDFVQDELGVPVRWTEDRATDTRGNAVYSAELLAAEGIHRVALVTHAWHMPRARAAFERTGLQVLPAPMGAQAPPSRLLEGLLPRGSALRDSCWAVHEWIGRAWYRVRG